MKHWHREAEIRRALGLYRTGMSAEKVAQEIDPGSSKRWVLKAVKDAGETRSPWATKKGWTIRDGYVLLRNASHPRSVGGYVREHIAVWDEAHPDDPSGLGDIIHHRNGDKADNRPENLLKMPRAEHRKYKPRSRFTKGRGLVAKAGEDFAVSMGVTLREEDVGHDGFLGKDRIEIKARIGGKPGWSFLTDKEADQYIFVGLREDLSIVAAWMIPAKVIRGKQNINLTPNETRLRGRDPWNEYRVK